MLLPSRASPVQPGLWCLRVRESSPTPLPRGKSELEGAWTQPLQTSFPAVRAYPEALTVHPTALPGLAMGATRARDWRLG